MTFAERIRELRRLREWSVYDLARRLEVQSPGYVSKIEARGEIPSPEMVIKLAGVLGAEPEELIELAKEQKAKELTQNVHRKYDDAFALHLCRVDGTCKDWEKDI
jgi:transcriptional regulator with XRE-family HTH domain